MAANPGSAQLHPDHISKPYVTLIGVAVIMTTLATASVVIRYLSRRLTLFWHWDDWAILGALVFAYGLLITLLLAGTIGGAGYSIQQYESKQLEKFLQIILARNILYNASITLSKASVLLFYRRIFSVDLWFRLSMQMIGILVIGYFLTAELGLIFATNPVRAHWQLWLPHSGINERAFWLAMGIINVLLDVVILCLPQATIWRLQLSRERKVMISLVFLLGGFVCITSTVRLIYVSRIDVSNLTYGLTFPAIWTVMEVNTSIVCSSLPTIPSLYRYWRDGGSLLSKTGRKSHDPDLVHLTHRGSRFAGAKSRKAREQPASEPEAHLRGSKKSRSEEEEFELQQHGVVYVERVFEVEY